MTTAGVVDQLQQQTIHAVNQVQAETDPDEVQILISTHLTLLGERLKEISNNISNFIDKGHQPNLDRSLDILLDTVIYSSTVLLNLFQNANEIKAVSSNNRSEREINNELTHLAIYHLSTAAVQPANQIRQVAPKAPQSFIRPQKLIAPQQIVQVKTEF